MSATPIPSQAPPPPVSPLYPVTVHPPPLFPDLQSKNPRSSSNRPSSILSESAPPTPSPFPSSSSDFPLPAVTSAPPFPSPTPAVPPDPFPPLISSQLPLSLSAVAPSPAATSAGASRASSSPSFPLPGSSPSSTPSLPPPAVSPLLSIPPPHPVAPQRSYAQASRGVRGSGFVRSHASDIESFARLPRTGANIICGTKEGIPSFSFVNSDLSTVEDLYSKALVMKFLGGRPSLEASQREIQSWGLEQQFTIGPLTSRAFLLRFQDNKDLIRVLTRPSSLLITFPYKIFRWHNQCHILEDSCYAPVWINMPRLPLQCFIPEFLEAVANKIGRFLCFDKATSTLARPSSARLCVELDLRKAPPPFIWIGLFEGLKQPIIYERMPKFCNQCQVQGHTANVCPKGQREATAKQAEIRPNPNHRSTPPARQNATTQHKSILKKSQAQSSTNHIATSSSHQNPPLSGTTMVVPTHISTPNNATEVAVQSGTTDNQTSIELNSDLDSNVNALTEGIPPPAQSSSPHKAPAQPSPNHSKDKPKRKKVTFAATPDQPQSNIEANASFREAVNRQVATLDLARLKSASLHPAPSSVDTEQPSPTDLHLPNSATFHSEPISANLSDSESTSDSDPQPTSPTANIQLAQNPSEAIHPNTYDSEGEEPPREHTSLMGHAADDIIQSKPHNSKRNKRRPDKPLNVQLRVRKDPNPTSSC